MDKRKNTLDKKKKLNQEFLDAVKEKDLLKMMRVQKQIDDVKKQKKST